MEKNTQPRQQRERLVYQNVICKHADKSLIEAWKESRNAVGAIICADVTLLQHYMLDSDAKQEFEYTYASKRRCLSYPFVLTIIATRKEHKTLDMKPLTLVGIDRKGDCKKQRSNTCGWKSFIGDEGEFVYDLHAIVNHHGESLYGNH
ncbi:hypothetical protein CCR75_000760 [Bremia lactucae]|uniref:Uncharacterized protein n=1 Tax=Bremia lactucae TaxID=4779 RepID=A0A976IHJ6_BRELC|nr:hypothetical protein CCR75_000760 [Bremia lactucae]